MKLRMILNIDPIKSGITSIASALTGSFINMVTISAANTALQHFAWTIAGLAGIVSIFNGILHSIDWFKNRKKKIQYGEGTK